MCECDSIQRETQTERWPMRKLSLRFKGAREVFFQFDLRRPASSQ